jgi:hypothetical protein
MPKPCIVHHPYHGETVPAIHRRRGGKSRYLHFVASGELGKAEAVYGTLRSNAGHETKGVTKSKSTEKHWAIMFRIDDPDGTALYDVEVYDEAGAVLAVCKNVQFTEGKNSLTITNPNSQSVCPSFYAYGTSSTQSAINSPGCQVGGAAANVTVVQDTDPDGAWIVQFIGVGLTAPNTTTITVAQQDGSSGTNGGILVFNCVPPPGGP